MIAELLSGETGRLFAAAPLLDHTVSLPIVICLCSAFWILGLLVGTIICAQRAKQKLREE